MNEAASSERYPRRGRKAAPGTFSGQDDEAEIPGDRDVHFSDDGTNDSEDDEDVELKSRHSRKRPGEMEGSRRSKRSTKFASSMAEPTGISDLLAPRDVNKSPRRKRRNHTKSVITSPESDEEDERYKPKKKSRRGKQMRDSLAELSEGDELAGSDEEEYIHTPKAAVSADSEESGDEGDDEEPPKIQRIIGCKSERRSTWKENCAKMNSSEITLGSMWDQKDRESEEEDAFEERFLVKWNELSYLHCSWETQKDLEEQTDNAKAYLATFFRKSTNGYLFSPEERNDGDYFDPGFMQMERVLEVDYPDGFDATTLEEEDALGSDAFGMVLHPLDEGFESGVGRMIMVKWMNLPYSECSWEYERDLIINDVEYKQHLKDYLKRVAKPTKSERRTKAKAMDPKRRMLYKIFGEKSPTGEEARNKGVEQYQDKLKGHVFKNGGQLRDYQAEGVSWMISNYINERSCILADEMGLGKTLQTAATLNLIATELMQDAAFLIIAPLSTIPHWLREFQSWTDLNAIVYHGSQEDRRVLRQYEFAYPEDRPKSDAVVNKPYLRRVKTATHKNKTGSPWMTQVVIATPEMLVCDDAFDLAAINWEVLVVDESHRLKNHNSKLGTNLRDARFSFKYKILCTGTPIQNNMRELWTLMYFIDEETFGDAEEFLEKYGDMKTKESVDDLHETLRPYILRRLKEDVEKSMPAKEETIIETELTIDQKIFYKALYEKNVKFLNKGKSKALDGPSLNNLAMQLRKCCNHVCLLNGIEEELRKEHSELHDADFLVKGSGKLVLLDKLLPRLKEEGHRVLLFSQFKIMLDILEDYLDGRGMTFSRIDGSITGLKRQNAIDRFQSDDPNAPFIMMLSTRAGGVGINLTAADTCIIFDSDWNPQNDLQAQARCHRIGQTKEVKVFRLLSAKTYEMQMFNLSSIKMGLDQAVLKGFESNSGDCAMSKAEVENLLKHGAYAILSEEKAGTAENASNEFASQSIDDILARRTRTIVHEGSGSGGSNAGGTFSKASFKLTKSPDKKGHGNETEDVDVSDPDFWKKMLGDSYKEEETTHLDPKQRRRKMQTNYNEDQNFQTLIEGEGSDYSYESDADDDVEEGSKDKLKERAAWGGLRKTEWSKEQVDNLENLLCSYGYGNFPWTDAISQLNFHAKDTQELKRMAWSMVLLSFLETARNDVALSAKRAQKAAEKHRDSSESANGGDGGVLASNPAIVSPQSKNDQIEAAFQKLLHSNETWARQVLSDAIVSAKETDPRDPQELTKAVSPKGHHENKEAAVKEEFSKTVWSSLKNRGWTVKLVPDGPLAGSMVFSYRNQTFSTISDTVRRARSEHPELAQALDTITELVEAANKRSLDSLEENRKKHLALNFDSATAQAVEDFLVAYAPFQILVDREKTKTVGLGRRLINCCALMDTVFGIIKRNRISDCRPESVRKLASVLSSDKRRYVPHPEWTSYQDAVLVFSLFRHGFIENEKNYDGILRDPDIKWGAPFEQPKFSSETNTERDIVGKAKWEMLVQVAKRAVQALSHHSDIETFKNVNKESIAAIYGIKRSNDGQWNIEMSTLEKKHEKVLKNNCLEIPGRKELVKRARALLTTMSEASSVTKEPFPTNNDSTSVSHNFTKLDVRNECNLYLVELLRGFVKSAAKDKETRKDLTRPMCELLVKEAQIRADEEQRLLKQMKAPDVMAVQRCENSQQILKHIRLVQESLGFPPRLYKNVVRVILGDNPSISKSQSEPNFPPKPQSNLSARTKARVPDMMLESHGRKAIREARDYFKRNPTSNFSSASSIMYFTEIETLILSVACQHGMPAFSASWTSLVDPANCSPSKKMSWGYFGAMLQTIALSAEKSPGSYADDEAKSYGAEPEVLAKKTVMIFSKLMNRIGLISSSTRSEKGLGSSVVKWLTHDLTEWAKALQIICSSGEPLTFTASDFIDDCEDQEHVEVVSAFDKQRCRDVFSQVAALCHLRSAVANCSGDVLAARVQQASMNCLQYPDDLWKEFQPKGFKIGTDDLLLIKRLINSGFSEVIESKDSQGITSKIASKSYRQCFLNERILQHRVNELVRELHDIESRSGRDAMGAIMVEEEEEEATVGPPSQVYHQPLGNHAKTIPKSSKQRFV